MRATGATEANTRLIHNKETKKNIQHKLRPKTHSLSQKSPMRGLHMQIVLPTAFFFVLSPPLTSA